MIRRWIKDGSCKTQRRRGGRRREGELKRRVNKERLKGQSESRRSTTNDEE